MAGTPGLHSAYEVIQNIEKTHSPIPTPRATLTVGTFDALHGTFREAPQWRRTEETLIAGPQPQRVTELTTTVNTVNVCLQFLVVNRQGNFEVSLQEGSSIAAPPGQDTLTIDVG